MDDAMTVMLVGLEAALADELADDERFDVRLGPTASTSSIPASGRDAVVVAMDGQGPLELLELPARQGSRGGRRGHHRGRP